MLPEFLHFISRPFLGAVSVLHWCVGHRCGCDKREKGKENLDVPQSLRVQVQVLLCSVLRGWDATNPCVGLGVPSGQAEVVEVTHLLGSLCFVPSGLQ